MYSKLLSGMALACLASLTPAIADAQVYDSSLPINCTITRPRPVVSTQMRAQQVTTYRDVVETQVCHKQVVENIPVTSYKNVTVDEGGYQMVWVPKPVTKQVAQTTMQQQVKTVAVPSQTTRRIPQVTTQMVPYQTVQYVNETVPLQQTAFASSCNTCNSGMGMAFGSTMMAPQIGAIAPIYQPAPYTAAAAIPTMPAISVPAYRSAEATLPSQFPTPSGTVPTPYEETVPARGAAAPRSQSAMPRKTSMFQAVPAEVGSRERQSSYAR